MKSYHKLLTLSTVLAVSGATLFVGCDREATTIQLPAQEKQSIASGEIVPPAKFVNPQNPKGLVTPIDGGQTVTLEVKAPKSAKLELVTLNEQESKTLVNKYLSFENKGTPYQPLQSQYVELALEDRTITAKVKDLSTVAYGDYLFPVVVSVDNAKEYHFLRFSKQGEYVPLTEKHLKPMPPKGGKLSKPMKMVAYVETNDWDPRNLGNFILEKTKQPVFDMVILFAANMNWDAVANKRYIFFNKELQPIIKNPEVYIRPLQEKGIKVLIDILPNHQGVGYANFQSYEEALEFAKEAKMWTDKLGIDGWDVDEEYADYHHLRELTHPSESWMWYARAMKEVMPDKLLTLYDYNHSYRPTLRDELGKYPKDYFDYSWANYNEVHNSYAGIPNERYGQDSKEASRTHLSSSSLKSKAERNLNGGYGLLMVFNIKGADMKNHSAAKALSGATEVFYGQKTIFSGQYYPGPKD